MPGSGRGDGPGHKMVLVVRAELRLTPGKAAVQVAHAAVMLAELAQRRAPLDYAAWRAEGQKKIAVTAPTLADLEELYRRARGRGLLTAWVDDAGLTEVPPGTRTVLGIGPGRTEEVDAITGALPLL
ncbi:MAG TPA: aminoacyl-tRNA hydrolase [Thermoplasmata archaeon]|nr:aminoacyl-tRNA hydrolase [Thermoplasmata archaeon]